MVAEQEVCGMGNILSIHHVSLIVATPGGRSVLSGALLGLAVDPDRPDLGYPGAWLWVGERQIHLLEVPNPDPAEGRPVHGGRDRHVAMAVSDLDAVAGASKGAGVPLQRSRSGRRCPVLPRSGRQCHRADCGHGGGKCWFRRPRSRRRTTPPALVGRVTWSAERMHASRFKVGGPRVATDQSALAPMGSEASIVRQRLSQPGNGG